MAEGTCITYIDRFYHQKWNIKTSDIPVKDHQKWDTIKTSDTPVNVANRD